MVFCLVGCNVLFNSFTCLNLLSFFISNLTGGRCFFFFLLCLKRHCPCLCLSNFVLGSGADS